MKKLISLLCVLALALGCVLSAGAEVQEITLDQLTTAVTPLDIAANGPFAVTMVYTNTGIEILEGRTTTRVYVMNGEYCECNIFDRYGGDFGGADAYFTTDPADPAVYYLMDDGAAEAEVLHEGQALSMCGPLFEFDETAEITGTETIGDSTVVTVIQEGRSYVFTLAADGRMAAIELALAVEGLDEPENISITFDYSSDLTIDYSAKEANPDFDPNYVPVYEGTISIATTDINNNEVTDDLIRDAKLVMVNLWEPWCKPCTGEMPDLEKLYETYKDQGLIILGVYSTFEMDEQAMEIVESLGISYPILRAGGDLLGLAQDYVPATFFLTGDGEILTSEPVAGAQSYETWESMITQFLQILGE